MNQASRIETEIREGLEALRAGRIDSQTLHRLLDQWVEREQSNAAGVASARTGDRAETSGDGLGGDPDGGAVTLDLGEQGGPPAAGGSGPLVWFPYRRLRPLARGGLGVVSVAQDEALGREVAYKELRAERADDPASRARFVREAELTGRLEHPGVVPVYGLGVDEQGRPFYVMRLVRGETLRATIERLHAQPVDFGGLEFRRVLARLVAVCQAVEFAHRHGVIHRDIKPDNVLLGPYGETLLVDWGLAKVVGSAPEADLGLGLGLGSGSLSTLETQAGLVLGTPAYMSPEQAAGGSAIGPAADVFSLGATLYAVLVGQPPRSSTHPGEAIQEARERPVSTPRERNRRVPRALDAVVRKATAHDPAERYASARALADDLERWLADEPVLAEPEPWPERLRRWGRRHRTWVTTAAGTTAVAAVAFAALAVREGQSRAALAEVNEQLRDAQRQTQLALDRAERSYRQARAAVDESLARIAEDPRLARRDLRGLRGELLAAALRYYQQFLEERGMDPVLEMDAARAHSQIGDILMIREGPEAALVAYRQSERIWRGLRAARGGDPALEDELAEVVNAAGTCLLELGRFDEARAAFREAFTLDAGVVAREPSWEVRRRLAQIHQNLAAVAMQMGEAAESLEHLQLALTLREALVAERPEDARVRAELARPLFLRGYRYFYDNQPMRAEADWDRALVLFREAIESGTADEETRLSHGALLSDRATLLRQAGDYEGALRLLDEGEQNWRGLVAESPRDAAYRLGLAQALIARADLLLVLKRIDPAEQATRAAKALLEVLVREEPESYTYRRALAKSLDLLGRVALARGDRSGALEAYKQAVRGLETAGALSPLDQYSLACYRSQMVGLLPAESADRETTAQAAVAALRAAIAGGLRILDHFRADPDLDPLRGRADFETVLSDLAFPESPFAAER